MDRALDDEEVDGRSLVKHIPQPSVSKGEYNHTERGGRTALKDKRDISSVDSVTVPLFEKPKRRSAMNVLMKIVMLLLCVAVSGCGKWNTAFRNFSIDDGTGAMIDIKQRAVIVSRQPQVDGQNGHMQTLVCAEPSPDALSAYAAELAGNVNILGKVNAGGTAASQESAAFVGLRTQSIQLLRDSLYRICEGYMSGALKKEDYYLLTRRHQRYMIALLGIEQLTGALRSPPVTINTEGKAEVAASLSGMRQQIETIEQEIAKKLAEQASLESERSSPGITEERKKQIESKIQSINAAIKGEQVDKDAIREGLKDARGLVAGGSSAATISSIGLASQRSDQHIQAVAGVVENIVLQAMGVDDLGHFCWTHLTKKNPKMSSSISGDEMQKATVAGTEGPRTLKELCLNRLSQNDADRAAARTLKEKKIELYESAKTATIKEKLNILNKMEDSSESLHTPPSVGFTSHSFYESPNRFNPTLTGSKRAEQEENHNIIGPYSGGAGLMTMGLPKQEPSQTSPSGEAETSDEMPFQIIVKEVFFNPYHVSGLEDLKQQLRAEGIIDSLTLCSQFYNEPISCLYRDSFTVDAMSESDFEWLTTKYKGPTEKFRFLGGLINKKRLDPGSKSVPLG